MKILVILWFILVSEIYCETSSYRFDYSYYPEIGGSIKLHLVPDKWLRASHRCEAEGSILAWPVNRKLLARMTSILKEHKTPRAFSGIHAMFSKGDFSSVDGIPLAKISIPWLKGEPDNAGYNEDCLALTVDGSFADVNCSDVYPYMCYKQHDRNVIKNNCGTTDPEYIYSNVTNFCYKLHTRVKNWNTAYQICYAEGAHLVTIDSDEEINVIRKILFVDDDFGFIRCSHRRTLAGETHAGYFNTELGWYNVYGKLLGDNLGPSSDMESDPSFKNECATITRKSLERRKLLNYITCIEKYPFMCKKAVDSLLATGKTF